MQLNECGRIVHDEWVWTSDVRPDVELDIFVVMPNHFHGILIIHSPGGRDVLPYAPTSYVGTTANQTPRLRSPSQTVDAVIRGFKSASTKRINELRKRPGAAVWQRNYYEHIIRDEESMNRIRHTLPKTRYGGIWIAKTRISTFKPYPAYKDSGVEWLGRGRSIGRCGGFTLSSG